MRKQRIYLETTILNYFFQSDRGIMHTATVKLFEEIKSGKFEAYASTVVISELSDAPEPKRTNMLNLIGKYGIIILEADEEAGRLADLYIKEKIIPKRYKRDGVHIAIAAINELDIILKITTCIVLLFAYNVNMRYTHWRNICDKIQR